MTNREHAAALVGAVICIAVATLVVFAFNWPLPVIAPLGLGLWVAVGVAASLTDHSNDATKEVTGTIYTSGTNELGSKTVTYDTRADQVRLDAANERPWVSDHENPDYLQEQVTMQYEFKLLKLRDVLNSIDELERELNQLGSEGWKVVGSMPNQISHMGSWTNILVLGRKRAESTYVDSFPCEHCHGMIHSGDRAVMTYRNGVRSYYHSENMDCRRAALIALQGGK